jgi:phosphatidylethanolamine-binding protein (PEBP) family uncharacterized protein
MKKITLTVCGALTALGLVSSGCGGTDPPAGTGGASSGGAGTGGVSTGGVSTGGTSTGGASTGGVTSTGGTDMGGMGGGAGAGTGGGTGSGGAPVVRTPCDDIPSLGAGDDDLFVVDIDGFEFCEPIPAIHTCDEKPFPEGTSPEINWTDGPAGTLSYAVVFKDLSVLEINDPADPVLYNRGYHWAIWDIPAAANTLPAALPEGHEITGIPALANARQWASFKDYSFFGPCPNFDPAVEEEVTDSYSFVVYALPIAPASLIPSAVTTTSPVRAMDDYFKTIALAVTEYRGTSDAHADELDPALFPPTAAPPCPTGGEQPVGCLPTP